MKNLILKALLFLIVLTVGLASLSTMYSFVLDRYALSEDKLVELNDKILVIGDSHLECAINPYLIDAINICKSSEEPIITYSKLLYLVEKKNIRPQKIIFGLSYHIFSDCGDIKLGNITQYQIARLQSNLLFLDNDTLLKYLDVTKLGIQTQALRHHQNIFKTSVQYHDFLYQDKLTCFRFLGGFYGSPRNNLDEASLTRALNNHYGIERQAQISHQKIDVLKNILNWSKQNNIEIVFVNAPLHEKYRNSIPVDFKNKVDSVTSHLVKYNGMNYINYSAMTLNDTLYGDFDHINYYGSRIFTEIIDSIISSH